MRRRMMMIGSEQESILPAGYTRLQYIYNINDAYIDTGISISNEDELEFDRIMISNLGGDKALWGARDSATLYSWVNMYDTGGFVYPRWGGVYDNSICYSVPEVKIKNNIWHFYDENGREINTWDSNAGVFNMSTTITLFGCNRGGETIQYQCRGIAMSKFIIKNKWHGIPCISPNNVVGMYDIVNNVFHGSENSTAFIAGPNY